VSRLVGSEMCIRDSYEVILVDIDGTLTPKRVVSLECGVSCKTVGVILRDLDFPDPNFWWEEG
jgi:hypothetical protein